MSHEPESNDWKSKTIELVPGIFDKLELTKWEDLYEILATHYLYGKIDRIIIERILKLPNEKDRNKIFDSLLESNIITLNNYSDLLQFQDIISSEALQKIVDKVMTNYNALIDPKIFDLLMRAVFKLDDIDNLNTLFIFDRDWDINQYIDLITSFDMLKFVESNEDKKIAKEIILKSAEVAPLDFFKRMIDKYRFDISEIESELVRNSIRADNLPVLKYLVEVKGAEIDEEILFYIISVGTAQILEYVLETHPEIIKDSSPLNYLCDHRELILDGSNIEFYLEAFKRGLGLLKVLLRSPLIDPRSWTLLRSIYPKIDRNDPEIRNLVKEVDETICEYVKVIISDPRVNPDYSAGSASVNENIPALTLILSDYRVNIGKQYRNAPETYKLFMQTYEGLTLPVLLFSHYGITDEVYAKRLNRFWSFREVTFLEGLSYEQKLELLTILRHNYKLDDLSVKLLDNQNFRSAYLSSNKDLAEMLNIKNVPWIDEVNHSAAAALYGNEIMIFKDLVPVSTYWKYMRSVNMNN